MREWGRILLSLCIGTSLEAAPITDPFVKNLTLVGVIHVEGSKTKGQSVAVLREKASGKTRILHKGDSILDADLEVRELGPQEIILVRGSQRFILRVENQPEANTAAAHPIEAAEVELPPLDSSASNIVEIPNTEPSPAAVPKPAVQRFEPKVAPGSVCEGEECPGVELKTP